MCYYRVISMFTCGHEEVDGQEIGSPVCLYGVESNDCGIELGRVHIVEVRLSEYCQKCLNVEKSFKRVNRPSPFVPRVTRSESEKQANNRAMLEQFSRPAQRPMASRVAQINSIARGNLARYLAEHPEVYNASNFMWFVMFIASLPGWLDRTALVSELEPWFATLFDEESQLCVRPSLRSMNCEHTLNDVMVWKLEGPAIYIK
ncbi:hypothetical protein F4820DRAFT_471278 [Hypoxylon rubiginosum]|uniref:Uncharacterized protein n=1 Tax=Hypoxylon rubiginosum TaxID=110542 RepID=A0ACB9ZCY6_9PEZI|nr:hypothetical protein F4820DRAFT_471278 [Hypoxylon rubiginosum]